MSTARAIPFDDIAPAAANDNAVCEDDNHPLRCAPDKSAGFAAERQFDSQGQVPRSTYDARGNVTTLGSLSFVYDYSDQPTILNGSLNGTSFNSETYRYAFNDPINNIDSDGRQVTSITNPIENGEARGCDAAGCGDYGATRGRRTHNGYDINGDVGDDVVAPIGGTIREIAAVYTRDNGDKQGVEITNNDTAEEVVVKVFYVDPSVETGDVVEEGDDIGIVQDVASHWEERGTVGMENHVHLQISQDGDYEDPDPLIDD